MPRATTFHKFRLPSGAEYQSERGIDVICAAHPEAKITHRIDRDAAGNLTDERIPTVFCAERKPKQRPAAKPPESVESAGGGGDEKPARKPAAKKDG